MARIGGWPGLLGGGVLAWCLVATLSHLHAARARPHDRMAEQEAEFLAFVPYLPAAGSIGYLQPFDGWSDSAVRTHYAAQYALAPRVVPEHRSQEFVIVASGAARPGGEPRLAGFFPVATFPGGHSLFRRFP